MQFAVYVYQEADGSLRSLFGKEFEKKNILELDYFLEPLIRVHIQSQLFFIWNKLLSRITNYMSSFKSFIIRVHNLLNRQVLNAILASPFLWMQ